MTTKAVAKTDDVISFELVDRTVGFRESEIEKALESFESINKLQTYQLLNRLALAELLAKVHENSWHIIANQEEMGGFSVEHKYRIGSTYARSWDLFCHKFCNIAGSTGYQYVKLYQVLMRDNPEFFEQLCDASQNHSLPPLRRLMKISRVALDLKKDEQERLLHASTLEHSDFEAEWKEVVEDKSPEQASEETEQEAQTAKSRIQDALAVTEGNRTLWKSKHFREWIRGQQCVISRQASFGQVHPHHVHTKGAGHDDPCNLIPLSYDLHQEWHKLGDKIFRERHGVGVAEFERWAVEYQCRYLNHLEEERKNND